MTVRESTRRSSRRLALVLPPVLIAIFAIVICQSTGNGLWAQASKQPPPQKPGAAQPARPAPTPNPVDVQRLVSLKTSFVNGLNEALQKPENPSGKFSVGEIVSKKIGPQWFEEHCWIWLDVSFKAIPLTHAQLQEFRDVTARQIDEAIKLEQAGKGGARLLGDATVRGKLITGTLHPVAGPAPLKPMSSQ